jgi:hypothetical protein
VKQQNPYQQQQQMHYQQGQFSGGNWNQNWNQQATVTQHGQPIAMAATGGTNSGSWNNYNPGAAAAAALVNPNGMNQQWGIYILK